MDLRRKSQIPTGSIGAMLSGEIIRIHGEAGLSDGLLVCKFKGSAGQSFGAFLARGIHFELEGDANDYLGKGLFRWDGLWSCHPKVPHSDRRKISSSETHWLYGATSGEAYIRGVAGERFAVRNSGALAVVEGVGDHCCEYMTGGRVVVLGQTGRNFAAGMSGGIAYVLNANGNLTISATRVW